MTGTMLKATTALTVSLGLIQPAPVVAQAIVGADRPRLCVLTAGAGCGNREWRIASCAEDPQQEGCAPIDGVIPDQPVLPEAVPEQAGAAPDPAPQTGGDAPPVAEAPAEPDAAVAAEPVTANEAVPPMADAPVTEAETAAPVAEAPAGQNESSPPVAEAPAEPDAAVAAEPVTANEAVPPVAETPVTEAETAAPVAEAPAGQNESPPPAAAEATPPAADGSGGTSEQSPPVAEAPAAEQAPAAESGSGESIATPPVAEPVAADPVPAADGTAAETALPPVAADPIPVPTAEQEAVLETLMADPDVAAAVDTLAQTVAPEAPVDGVPAAAAGETASGLAAVAAALAGPEAAAGAAEVVTQTVNADAARSSTQDFTSALSTAVPSAVAKKDEGMSDLEKAGLVALGAVVVGMLVGNNRVVANSGDRVVVDRGDGNLGIWKDDNANLRTPGVVETTERFSDGSTLTTLKRPDGSQIVTIRDATGRVLRRDRINVDGSRVAIIDDTPAFAPVEVSRLPRPRVPALRVTDDTDIAMLRAMLAEAEATDLGRSYSLNQVREIRELRDLSPELTGNPITFATGSSAIRPEEAGKLVQIGRLMADMIADNPREVFLIEGHTDAVGSAAYNLALSDRRAESVALALTEVFGVPPENMVVQGYGERFLKVPVLTDEPANRRVALRRITWLVDAGS